MTHALVDRPASAGRPGTTRPRRVGLCLSLAALLVGVLLPGAVLGQDEETLVSRTPEEVSQMALHLQLKFMSPYCPGANLRDCTSSQAQVLRDEIRGWVQEGHSEDWITAQMVNRFGEEILAAPPFRGFGMLAWIMPVVGLLLGFVFVLAYIKRQNRLKLTAPDSGGSVPRDYVPSDEAERRLEEELSARSG